MQNIWDTEVEFEQYIIQREPGRKERAENWQVAIGLQAVDSANYQNLPAGVERTSEYLELFFRNLLMGEKNELKNRYLHIRWKDMANGVAEEPVELSTQKTTNGSRKSTGKMQLGSEKRQKSSEKILVMISENASITTEQMAARLGISTRAVEKHLSNLKAKGLLRRVGPDKGGHWEVVIKN